MNKQVLRILEIYIHTCIHTPRFRRNAVDAQGRHPPVFRRNAVDAHRRHPPGKVLKLIW